MPTMVLAAAFGLAFASVALMGYAIQRGATCTVAAVDEWVSRGSWRRLRSMVEASLWVAGGLLIAHLAGHLPAMPAGYAVTGWTVAGGVLLGFGAWLNGACVFGAVARLGSGEWAYAATPLGYFIGCASVQALFAPAPPQRLAEASVLFSAPQVALALILVFVAWRLVPPLRRLDLGALRARLWQPHAATGVIGVTFVVTLLLAGAWAYTDLLADLARGVWHDVLARVLLFVALMLGAAWGGYTAGRWRPAWPAARQWLRCLAGGALMGWGTLLIPGSNDGLILVGMPLLRPYAWLAFATMAVTIAAAQLLARRAANLSRFHHRGPAGSDAA